MKIHKPIRDGGRDLPRLFRNPPHGYGIVPFYWWMGDPLTRERLAYETDRMKGHSVAGLQINYAHICEGGLIYGLTYPSDPPLFSDEWWDLTGFLMKKGKEDGFSVSLSDYTLGSPGQGYYTDEILAENPDMRGRLLQWAETPCKAGEPARLSLPDGLLNVSFLEGTSCTDLTGSVCKGVLSFTPPADGRILWVWPEIQEHSLDPMHPLSGKKVCEKFFGPFEEHFPGEGGDGLNFFFSDELNFNIRGNLWNRYFAEEFQKQKGYDLLPLLPALFADIGDVTPKVRLDYSDVIVRLEEANYFGVVYDWHESRGMVYGCDHGGRGKDVTEFGDYFRTQKYNQGPGCDQPFLDSDIVKNKVAGSIAHLYDRPRVWLEGFHSSGWQTSSADFADAVARNFVMGHNLLSIHGLYYSTHGGWWEWAPPCNGFHAPYWDDMSSFFQAVERMSFLLSQGRHVCDVGILYPVAPAEAGMDGETAVQTAFETAELLYRRGVDLDFLDFESIERAEIRDGRLCIAGECYRVVILPAMRAVRFGMMEKLLAFSKNGGTVLFLGALPEASDRAGANDPALNAIVEELSAVEGACLSQPEEVLDAVSRIIPADFRAEGFDGDVYLNHRRLGDRDLYMVYGLPKGTRCTFRTVGEASLWDPFTGKRWRLPSEPAGEGFTRLALPLNAKEIQILVFDRSGEAPDGDFPTESCEAERFALKEEWEFELLPNLDNRFGDYAIPAYPGMVGPELRMASYAQGGPEIPPESAFSRVERFSYGPYFQVSGPFADERAFRAAFEAAAAGETEDFAPYAFSMRYGVWNDPGKQGFHGLKELVADEFLTVGLKEEAMLGSRYLPDPEGFGRVYFTRVFCPQDGDYRILSGSMAPDLFALDGKEQPLPGDAVHLKAGVHLLAAAYRNCGRTYLTVVQEGTSPEKEDLAMSWYRHPGLAPFVCRGSGQGQYGFFRFQTPPGLKEMEIPCETSSLSLWVNGLEIPVSQVSPGLWRAVLPETETSSVPAVLRIALDCGKSGGALIDERICFTCGAGRIKAGDWGKIDGLSCYSGRAAYTQRILLPETLPEGRPVLRLADAVSTVRAVVNGTEAGVKVMGPWEFDLTGLLKPEENELRLEICNTLSNHYRSIPTRYRGEAPSGLLDSAELVFLK